MLNANDPFVLTETERLRIVREAALFVGLPDGAVTKAAANLRSRGLLAGQYLFMKGDDGDAAYLVVTGRINIVAHTEAGREVVLNTILPGEYFGELALLDGAPRNASAVAGEPTQMVVISRRHFQTLMTESAEFSAAIASQLAARFRKASEMLEAAHLKSLSQRLAGTLLTLAEQQSEGQPNVAGLVLTVSQSELATHVGASRVSVNKHLQRWQSFGILSTGRGKVILYERRGLVEAMRGSRVGPF